MDYSEIINKLIHQLDSKAASTLFVNGAPGTGKTFLQYKLAKELPQQIPHLKVLGPYNVKPNDSVGFLILNDLFDLGYLTDIPNASITNDLNSTWRWLKENMKITARQAFVILIDLDNISWDDYHMLRIWFSSMRYLEHLWESGPTRLAAMITCFWDHPGLNTYYDDQLKLSFPYTINQNYIIWEEIPLRDSLELSGNLNLNDPIQVVYGKILHEIAGGNPKIMQDIQCEIPPGIPTIHSILNGTRRAANSGSFGQTLVNTWKKLPSDSIKAIKELLLLRHVPVKSLPTHLERLRIAGIISERVCGNQRYITLHSWYIELLLRLHIVELGIGDRNFFDPDLAELMPTISVLHQDAYLIIHQIENLLRNFLVTHLLAERSTEEPFLSGLLFKENTYINNGKIQHTNQDAQERAELWQARSQENGLPIHINPTIAYLSLGDLGGILNELGKLMDSSSWLRVAAAIEQVVYVRDAVMHNQMIEFSDLQKIHNLQTDIFAALGETYESF